MGGRGVIPPIGVPRVMSPPLRLQQSEQKLKTSEEGEENDTVNRGVVTLNCKTCKKSFETRASHSERRQFCSMECRKLSPDLKRTEEMTSLARKEKLTPAESAKIRAQIAGFMEVQIQDAHNVVMGAAEWNPTQARVFGMLLNKVVPDLNASFVQHEHQSKQLADLSREDLEAIASGISTITVEHDEIMNEDN